MTHNRIPSRDWADRPEGQRIGEKGSERERGEGHSIANLYIHSLLLVEISKKSSS
jgi:hypothetical protein